MQLEKQSLELLTGALQRLESGFTHLADVNCNYDYEAMRRVLLETAEKLWENYPFFHPAYAAHMFKPPHPVARIAYMLGLWVNPNNHSFDAGQASSRMEKEAVNEIARMFGWDTSLGHLCGGGTMANLEALWVSGKLHPGKTVVASEMAHFTHARISEVLHLDFQTIACDDQCRMDIPSLEKALRSGQVGMVVASLGTTGTGSCDLLSPIIQLKEKYGFRLHVDSAYGGYFILAGNLNPTTRRSFDLLKEADSIVIDPHKHGLQPFGCGCVLFKNPDVGRFYQHDSPYTYFRSEDLHLGEISLECSRAGASAIALWATQKLLPMQPGGEFASGLEKSREAAMELYRKLALDVRFRMILAPELDIVIWAPAGKSASQISRQTEAFLQAAASHHLYLAKLKYPTRLLERIWPEIVFDAETVTCLRSCLMKPEHLDYLGKIWELIDRTAGEISTCS
jgi:tyrosine decarboxylase / aspartate 1-decarboxylase